MTKYTGNDMVLVYKGATINNLISVEIPETREEYDVTVAGESDMKYLPGKRSRTVTINGLADTGEADYDQMVPTAAAGTMIFYPRGITSTYPKRTMQAFVLTRNQPENHNAPTPLNVTMRVDGAITDGAVA